MTTRPLSPSLTPRYALLTVKLYYFCFFGALGALLAYLNVFLDRQGLSGTQIGWLQSVAPLVALAASPFWGAVADRWQVQRAVLVLCALGAGLTSLLFLSTKLFWLLLLIVVVMRFFLAPIPSLVDSATMEMVSGEAAGRKIAGRAQRARWGGVSYGRQRLWGSVGFVLASYGLGRVLVGEQIAWVFWLHALLLAGGCLTLSLLLPVSQTRAQQGWRAGLGQLLTRRGYAGFLLAMGLYGVGFGAYSNFLALHVLALGGSEAQVGAAWALNAVAEIPIMFVGAAWFARYSHVRLLLASLVGFAFVWGGIGLARAPWQVMVVVSFFGVCYGVFWVAAVSYASDAAPPGLSATSQTLFGAVQSGLGISLGALLSGYVWDAFGGGGVFALATGAALGAALLLGWSTRGGEQVEHPDLAQR